MRMRSICAKFGSLDQIWHFNPVTAGCARCRRLSARTRVAEYLYLLCFANGHFMFNQEVLRNLLDDVKFT